MFIEKANTTFNNSMFSYSIIRGMHEQMTRLYQAARELRGIDEKGKLAALLNVSHQNLNAWEKRGISDEGLLNAQAVLGCDAIWLRDNVGRMIDRRTSAAPMSLALMKRQNDEIEIPQYADIGGAMGHGLTLKDQPGEIHGWRVTPEWITKNVKSHTGTTNLRIVTGFGDSMQPLYNPGDPLLVDIGVKTVDFDAIYFFRIGGEGFIKRLQRIPGQGLMAISDNKNYREWTVTKDMDFEVFARVIKVWRGSDF